MEKEKLIMVISQGAMVMDAAALRQLVCLGGLHEELIVLLVRFHSNLLEPKRCLRFVCFTSGEQCIFMCFSSHWNIFFRYNPDLDGVVRRVHQRASSGKRVNSWCSLLTMGRTWSTPSLQCDAYSLNGDGLESGSRC